MKKETILCDRCGDEGAKTAAIFVDRKMDGAGSMENEYEYADLCHKCALVMVEKLTKLLPPIGREGIVAETRKKVQP